MDKQIGLETQKHIEFKGSLSRSVLKQFKKRTNINGLLEVEMIFVSHSTKDLVYKVDWLDEDGFVLKDVINEEYHTLRIPANQEVILRKVAPNISAKDIRIKIDNL